MISSVSLKCQGKQNRTQFSANGTKGVEIGKPEISFASQWTHGNLPVRNAEVQSGAEEHSASKKSNLRLSKKGPIFIIL